MDRGDKHFPIHPPPFKMEIFQFESVIRCINLSACRKLSAQDDEIALMSFSLPEGSQQIAKLDPLSKDEKKNQRWARFPVDGCWLRAASLKVLKVESSCESLKSRLKPQASCVLLLMEVSWLHKLGITRKHLRHEHPPRKQS